MKFKRTTITINGEETKGYNVEGLDKSFRDLQVAVIKNSNRWHAYEAITGLSITPSNWKGGFSNKTREGILQIAANFLSNAPESGWVRMQEQLNYDLEIDALIFIKSCHNPMVIKVLWGESHENAP